MMDDERWDEYAHEEILQAAVRHLLSADDLDQICADADLPTLLDATGQPVTITSAHTNRDAGVLTLDRGVWLELSDGSRFGLTVTVSRRPCGEVILRPPGTATPAAPTHSGAFRRPAPGRAAGPCGCACTSGGFCGGCGHAGCGRR
jgi:hypothetical protein